jgi:hypothetical protein
VSPSIDLGPASVTAHALDNADTGRDLADSAVGNLVALGLLSLLPPK